MTDISDIQAGELISPAIHVRIRVPGVYSSYRVQEIVDQIERDHRVLGDPNLEIEFDARVDVEVIRK